MDMASKWKHKNPKHIQQIESICETKTNNEFKSTHRPTLPLNFPFRKFEQICRCSELLIPVFHTVKADGQHCLRKSELNKHVCVLYTCILEIQHGLSHLLFNLTDCLQHFALFIQQFCHFLSHLFLFAYIHSREQSRSVRSDG